MIFSPAMPSRSSTGARASTHALRGVPRHNIALTHLMIYTPGDAGEVAVVRQLLRGAVEHMGRWDCL